MKEVHENMAYEKAKGVLGIATAYSNGSYTYTKLDEFIGANNYTATPNQMQDLDSYVNANGKLKRNVLPHSRSKIEFNTPYLKHAKKLKLVKLLNSAMALKDGTCNKAERKVRIRFYNDWTDDYETAFCYIPDIPFQYGGTYSGVPLYLPVRVAFIEY